MQRIVFQKSDSPSSSPVRVRARGAFLSCALALTCLGWQSIETGKQTPATPVGLPVVVPVATETASGSFDVWAVNEATGDATLSVSDVAFLPIRAVGLRQVDALRLDRPATEGEGSVAPYIRLPKRGALYRVRRGSLTGILHINAAGKAKMMLEVADVGGGPALGECLGVSWRGDNALVATTVVAGGDVFALDLVGQGKAKLLTSNVGPLAVDEISLRVSRRAAWFVADGQLYCATDFQSGTVTAKVSAAPGVALPEIVQSENGEKAAVFIEEAPMQRRLVVFPRLGKEVIITPIAADYALPGYDKALGPWVALSSDGGMVAYMNRESPWHGKWSHEIFVRPVNVPAPSIKVTAEPDFPPYIDNVGVLGFVHDRVLTFFAGDEIISGVTAEDGVGAADWFAANMNNGSPIYKNLTKTSGETSPPFLQAPTLAFTQAFIDPRAERFLLTGQPVPGIKDSLVTTAIDSAAYDPTAFDLVTEVHDGLSLARGGTELLVISELDKWDDEAEVDLLRPLDSDLAGMFSVTDLDGEVMDRVTGHGSVMAAVIDYGSKQKPAFIIGTTGQLIMVGLQAKEISPRIHVSSAGHMTFGFGQKGGPYTFVSADPLRNLTKFKVPNAYGFPLHH